MSWDRWFAKRCLGALILGLFVLPLLGARPEAEALRAAYLEASGGAARWGDVRSLLLIGTALQADGSSQQLSVMKRAPLQFRVAVENDQGQRLVRIYDNGMAWQRLPSGAAALLPEAQAQTLAREAALRNALQRHGSQRQDAAETSLSFQGEVSLDETPVYILRITEADGFYEDFYLDRDSAQLLMLRRHEPEGDAVTQINFEAYAEVDGILVPMVQRYTYNGSFLYEARYQRAAVNSGVFSSLFKAPPELAQAQR